MCNKYNMRLESVIHVVRGKANSCAIKKKDNKSGTRYLYTNLYNKLFKVGKEGVLTQTWERKET